MITFNLKEENYYLNNFKEDDERVAIYNKENNLRYKTCTIRLSH